jgi:hypothetical protein
VSEIRERLLADPHAAAVWDWLSQWGWIILIAAVVIAVIPGRRS